MLTTHYVRQDVLKLLQNSKLNLLVLSSLPQVPIANMHTAPNQSKAFTELIKTL